MTKERSTTASSGHADSSGREDVTPPGVEAQPASAVAPGDCLGRYTILAPIGKGGMGEVFAAHDPELSRTIALKLIRQDRGAHASARLRLLREAQALARLHHPNVVTVHDVGRDDERVFLAMERIEGSTFTEWLKAGAHGWREVLARMLDAGRGLAAAHDAGIVHRDFKPDNVLVGKDRVVVVDFGLARAGDDSAEEAGPTTSAVLDAQVTGTGERVGTPSYMAPELHAGGRSNALSDQFSYCVSLWEALHGARPTIDKPLEAANAAVPAWINETIRRGLARDPAERWPSMHALLAELGRTPSNRRRLAAALLVVAALASVAVIWLTGSAPTAPKSVALLVRSNGLPADQTWIGLAAERRLAAELGATGRVRVVPADKTEEHPTSKDVLSSGAAPAVARLSRELGAERVVVLRGEAGSGALDLTATVYDARGERVTTVHEVGDALAASERLAAGVRERLGVARPTSLDSARAALPRSADAARKVAEGIALRRTFDIDGARRAFEEARDLEPDAPLTHDALAEIWTYLGYEERAAAESRRALELGSVLSRDERLRVEARSLVAAHEWDRAIDSYRALALLFPDEWDDALQVVETMVAAGRGTDALTTVEQLAKRPGGDRDARVLLMKARVASLRDDHALARDAARDARARALEMGLSGIVTSADQVICIDAGQSGESEEGLLACKRASDAYRAMGNFVDEAVVAAGAARGHIERGHFADARAVLEEVEPRARRAGPNRGLVQLLRRLAHVEMRSRHDEKALELAREALTMARALGSARLIGAALSSVASAETERGNYEEGLRVYGEGVDVDKKAGLWTGAANDLMNIALVHWKTGSYARGKVVIDESLALFRRADEHFAIARALAAACILATELNQLDEAERYAREALAVREASKLTTGQARHDLAQVLIAKGDLDAAVEEATKAVKELHDDGDASEEVFALEDLANALLAKGDAKGAREACERAIAGADPAYLTVTRNEVTPILARARFALGDKSALADLERFVRDVKDPRGTDGLNARVALGELLMKSGDTRRARAVLTAAQADAQAMSHLLTAARAAKLLEGR